MKTKNLFFALLMLGLSTGLNAQKNSNLVKNETLNDPSDTIISFVGNVGYVLTDSSVVSFPINDNEWQYIAITKNANNNSNIYKNGQLVAQGTFENNSYSWYRLDLGAVYYTSYFLWYKGLIDEIRVSNTIRSAESIAEYYASNSPFESDGNTIGLWNFNQSSGNEILASVGNNGTTTNAEWSEEGRFGNCLSFNGIDARASIPATIPTSEMTFEIWIKPNEIQNSYPVSWYGMHTTGLSTKIDTLITETLPQNICQSIGNDSLALLNNGYIIGPNSGGGDCTGLNIHTDSKWINVAGADSLFVNTFQHRFYDFSKIYDENDNLIWSWLGENVPEITWYFRSHSVFVGGNDSVRIEFHQGYPDDFCNGYLQVVGMYCTPTNLPNVHVFTQNQTEIAGRIIEIPVLTSELTEQDGIIAYQFDFNYDIEELEYNGNFLEGTLAEGGMVQVNETTGKLSIAWASQNPIIGEGAILKLRFKVIAGGEITPTITNALYNTSTVNTENGVITANYLYGDIDVNDYVQAYDAALALQYSIGLDPIPNIDPLPWESWRTVVANVDGEGGITANDASEILKYTVDLIETFPVENERNLKSSPVADVIVSIENGEIVFKSSGELFGLNIYVHENFNILGSPEVLNSNILKATNISDTKYTLGLATAYAPVENEIFMKIPVSLTDVSELTFDLIVNTTPKSITLNLTTGITSVNENNIVIFPNPVSKELTISHIKPNSTISVFDISGKLIISKKATDTTERIDVSVLKNGIYLIRVDGDSVTMSSRFMKY